MMTLKDMRTHYGPCLPAVAYCELYMGDLPCGEPGVLSLMRKNSISPQEVLEWLREAIAEEAAEKGTIVSANAAAACLPHLNHPLFMTYLRGVLGAV